jgi:hypothetical protein
MKFRKSLLWQLTDIQPVLDVSCYGTQSHVTIDRTAYTQTLSIVSVAYVAPVGGTQ